MSTTVSDQRQLVVSGVGYKLTGQTDAGSPIFNVTWAKPNIGAAVALAAAKIGYRLVLVARTPEKLNVVADSIRELVPGAEVTAVPTDLLNPEAVKRLAEHVRSNQPVDLVHSAGLGAGDYSLPDGNPYLPVDLIPSNLPLLEYRSVVTSLLHLVQAFLPQMMRYRPSRLVVVSSMSAIRPYPLGFSHAAGKGGLHQATRSLALELGPLGVELSEILPGMVDTGSYDPPSVDRAIRDISRSFGYDYGTGAVPKAPVESVADAVILALTSHAHVLSISLISRGQLPHHGG